MQLKRGLTVVPDPARIGSCASLAIASSSGCTSAAFALTLPLWLGAPPVVTIACAGWFIWRAMP